MIVVIVAAAARDQTEEAQQKLLARHASRRHIDTEGTLAEKDKPTEKKKAAPKVAAWKHALAGGVAGVAEVAATMRE